MTYNFGQSVIRHLYPLADDRAVNLPSQSPAIYLYSTQPSMSDAIAGLSAVQTVTAWTESNTEPYARTFSFSAITDPQPTSTPRAYDYWEVVRYVLTTGGETQTIVRSFSIERAQAQDSAHEASTDSLSDIFPSIGDYIDLGEQHRYIELAEEWIKIEIRARGLDWGRLSQLDQLTLPVAYMALHLFADGQSKRNAEFAELSDSYLARYNYLMKQIKLGYDTDSDGKKDSEVTPKPAVARFLR